ncbi:MAG: hypothetical protein B7Y74_01805, partial [Novosphingobium sp. 35-62-5]
MAKAKKTKGTVGIVGLGIMGGSFARNLTKNGWRVVGFDLSAAARRQAQAAGVEIVKSAATVAAEAPVVLTSLPKPQALLAVAKEIADVMEVRRMLEGQAVRLACTRRTADNIREITAILEETNKRLSKKQSIEREDEAFHLAIFSATKNDILLRVARSFYELSRHRRKVYFADQNRGRQSYEDHCTILEAIEERRVGLAEQQMNAHLSR